MTTPVFLCADVGSTYTKVAAVGIDGALHATASHRTTSDTDVLDGLNAAREQVRAELGDIDIVDERVCSSAGGGLRLAVVGNEPLVTATAAHRAGLSAGARVVGVFAGDMTEADLAALAASSPDVLLLAGGTDGGDATVLTTHARILAEARSRFHELAVPVVLAGNRAVSALISDILTQAGYLVSVVDNVLPKIGHLNPGPARVALREAFLSHVIAGKNLSATTAFAQMVRSATPDTVLTAVELLAEGHGEYPPSGDIVVVDVGGATTDVYSVLTPDAELEGPRREVAGTTWHSRTVEGDLGLRHTATGIVEAATAEGILDAEEVRDLTEAATFRCENPSFLPVTEHDIAIDLRLTQLAIMVATRRHARGERLAGPNSPLRGGKDLRAVTVLVGSGGVLRHHDPEETRRILNEAVARDSAGGYPVPDRATGVIDTRYVLGIAGLLAGDHPTVAIQLMRAHLLNDTAIPV